MRKTLFGSAGAFLVVYLTASWLTVSSLAAPVQATSGQAAGGQSAVFPHDPPDEFFAGNYAIVGQKPADGAAYKGRARIEIKDGALRLSRTVNGTTTVVDGKFVPGGESKRKCLQFRWKDSHGNAELFCQYGVDFDNYARLSCVWSDGTAGTMGLPGFESYYPLGGLSR